MDWSTLSNGQSTSYGCMISELETPNNYIESTDSHLLKLEIYDSNTPDNVKGDCSRISHSRLVYSVGLEVPILHAQESEAGNESQSTLSSQQVKSKCDKCVTSQGYPCLSTGHNDPTILRRVCLKLRNLVCMFPEGQTEVQYMCRVKWCGVDFGLCSLSTNHSLLRNPTFYLPASPLQPQEDWTLDIEVSAMGTEGLLEPIGFINLKEKHLSRAPSNRSHYNVTSGDEVSYERNVFCPASIRLVSQSDVGPLSSSGVEALSPMALNLLMCWEESFVSIPHYLALRVRAAENLASSSPVGHNRIVGRKRRRVSGLVQHDAQLWSSTNSVLSSSLGKAVFHGPGGLIPIPSSSSHDLQVSVSLWDYGLSTCKEEAQSLRIQCAVRCWIARRRVVQQLAIKRQRTYPNLLIVNRQVHAIAS